MYITLDTINYIQLLLLQLHDWAAHRRLLNNSLAQILTPITHLLLTWSYCQLLLSLKNAL